MAEFQWWCVARGEAWSWDWQPIPGVWLFVILFTASYWRLANPGALSPANSLLSGTAAEVVAPRRSRGRELAAISGLVLLWLTLDWPVGVLGAGYLASVHSLQFVMLAMIIPALLLMGVSEQANLRLSGSPRALQLLRGITWPPFAAIFFTIVMAATHSPLLLDRLMRSQLGSFSLDMLWLASGFLLAWPLIMKVPQRENFGPPLRILYIFTGTIAHVFIGMWLLSSQFPAYATYELAPRMGTLTATMDQHLAGAVILLLGTPLVLGAVTYIFFQWQGTGAEKAQE
jgi:putative membrane protein